MTRKFVRPLCFCGCGLERRPGSKYHDEKHQQAVAREKKRTRQGQPMLRPDGTASPCFSRHSKTHPAHTRGVTIDDPKCATPYRISKGDWQRDCEIYLKMGCKVRIDDGQELLL